MRFRPEKRIRRWLRGFTSQRYVGILKEFRYILVVAVLLGILAFPVAADSDTPECQLYCAFVYPMCLILRAIQLLGIIIAMVVMLIAGMRWIVLEDPEQRKVAKSYIFYSLLALVVVLLMAEFINAMIEGASGSYHPARITCGTDLDSGIAKTIKFAGCMVFRTMEIIAMILAVIAILYIGIKFMSTDDPAERSRAKMMMFNVLVGITLVILTTNVISAIVGNTGIGGVFSTIDCTDSKYIKAEITGPVEYIGCMFYWIMLVMAIALAIIVIMLAGLRWMLSDAPEDRQSAKNMVMYAIVGAMIAILAWQIVGAVMGQGQIRAPFKCATSPDSETSKLIPQVQYTTCLFIELLKFSVAGIATVLIGIAGLVWMFSEDPETRNKAKWLIGHVIIGALVIMAAVLFIEAMMGYGGGDSYMAGFSHQICNDKVGDDEITITATVRNIEESKQDLIVCVLNKTGGKPNMAAGTCKSINGIEPGATKKVEITSDCDPDWSLVDLRGAYYVVVIKKDTGDELEKKGPIAVPESAEAGSPNCKSVIECLTG